MPSVVPTAHPSAVPTADPTNTPTDGLSFTPTSMPSAAPTAWWETAPQWPSLGTYVAFGASSPLGDSSGHGGGLATRDGSDVTATCTSPLPCFVNLPTGQEAGLVTPAGMGQSSNGTTVCIRFRIWEPGGSGTVLRLLPIDNDRPSMGSLKYFVANETSMWMYTVTDASQLYDQWWMPNTVAADGTFTHVCLAWLLHGPDAQLRHRLVVDNQTFPLRCAANDCGAEQRSVPMVGAETVMCIGCTGFPEADRQTGLDVAAFAVWNTALTTDEMHTYIDLVAVHS